MPAVKGDGMRGLAVFISDIRNCKSKEAEIKRINKELANIRSKFKGDKTLDGYQKKKYVCKLLFIFLLGHDIDFGHMEAVNLLSSNKYTEKQIGYLFISVLISSNSELIRLIVQSIKNDLQSRNPVHVNLALQCIANIGSRDMCEAFGSDIPKLLVSADTIDFVKQSAALCLLRLFRTSQDIIPPGEYASRIIHLLNDQHMGVVTSAVSVIEALSKRWPEEYKGCVSLAISRLSRIVTSTYTDLQDYTYYFVPAPWLSVKLLRLLQNYPPPEDPAVKSRLLECLETILNKAQEPPKSKKVQHSNAKNAVLFEAIAYIIHMDTEPNLLVRACNQLGQFLTHKETNLRYLALESMCLLATSEFSHEAVRKHQETIILSLKTERDVSVRQRAVDLLYAMCDKSNATEIVSEMLTYLENADYSIREEMVLKVAILAEKYAQDYTWYVDVILNLIRIAGDFVSEEVWYRVIQIVVNREDVQGYAAKTVFEALQAPACHENMVKVGAYILGEFGNLIAGDPRSSPAVQFQLLHAKYYLCSIATRALLLSTYIKFINLFPEIKSQVQDILKSDGNIRNPDAELQQRAVEYLALSRIATADVLATVLEEMPPFTEKESSLLSKLKKKKPVADDSTGENVDGFVEKEKKQFPQAVFKEANSSNISDGVTSGTADLLGLGTPTAASNFAQFTSAPSPLLDVFGADTSYVPNNHSVVNGHSQSGDVVHGKDEDAKKFVYKHNGVLYEDSSIQVGVKMEARQNLCRLGMFYGNKSTSPMTDFTPNVLAPGQLSSLLNIQAKPVDSIVEAGAQVQQLINVECLQEYTATPTLQLQFVQGGQKNIMMKLPLYLCKFLEPAEMESEQFFTRWKILSQPNQESQKILNAQYPIDDDQIKAKLSGFGLQILVNVDPNPANFVAAGIVHTRAAQRRLATVVTRPLSDVASAPSVPYLILLLPMTDLVHRSPHLHPSLSSGPSYAASRRESISDLRRAGATPGPGWRVSCWDVSQQLRLPIRQRLMRKRSGSWSGPPSGSSSHHLLAIEEEDKPSSPCRGKPFNRALAQFTSCERRCASLDTPPTIQVTKVEKEEPVRSQSSQPAEEPAKPKSPEPHFTSMTTAGLSAMLRLKQKLDRKRSGSLPEDRLVVPDLTKHRSIPPSSLAIEDATPPASFSSPVSPAHKRVVRRSTGGSLPGTISPSPRSLAATSHNSALTLSPIPSPACSPLPSPGLSGPAIKFPLLAGSADNVTSVPAKKALTERRSTLADLLGGNAKRTSSPYTPSSVSSLLDLCLESKKRAIEGDFESADDEDQIILNLSYEHTVTRSTRRVTAVTDPPTADIIHFSGSSSEDDADARSIETTGDEVDPTVAPVLENRQECTVSQSTVYREESNEYKEVLNKITGKRALRPKLAAMASKLKNLGHRGSPKRGNTLPEMPDLCKSMRNESKEESWLRKASAPLPSRRREYTPRLQRQHADVLEDSDEKEKSPSGRRQREQCGGRKQSTPHTQKKRKGLDIQTSLVQQKIHPLAIHNPQLQQITRILGAVERKWSDPPSRCLTPELPERSQSNASDTSKRKQRRNDARNLTTAVDSFHSETERTEYWNSGGAGKSSSARALQCTKAGKTTGEKEISVTLQYARSIGFLVVTINKAKNLPYLKEAYVRIIRFEGSVLAETTHTSTVKGKSGPEFKETYMFGLEEEKLLISHLVIELWECDAMEEKRRFGYVVIGPHAGGSGCLQWTRMCKYPNFPSRMWHKFASADA